MIAILMGAVLAFTMSVLFTPMLIKVLTKNEMGQNIRDDGPFQHPHTQKAGTPTMGGIAIVVSALLAYVFAHIRTDAIKFSRAGLLMWFLICGLAFIGFVDDFLAIKFKRNLGLRIKGKTLGQLGVGLTFAVLSVQWGNVSTRLSFTRPIGLELGKVGWILLAVLTVYAVSNAVNLTDGLDGLASGASTLVFASFSIICFWQFRNIGFYGFNFLQDGNLAPGFAATSVDLAVVAACMTGAIVGFLWWNAPPASIFMGDVGSLAIGGAIAGFALYTNTVLLLPIIGGLFVLETLSVIAQIISVRIFNFRVFKMAPFHHHFELKGWPETTVIIRFWIVGAAFTALGVGIFYADFLSRSGVV